MAKKELTFKGKTIEELEKMSMNDFMNLVTSRQRRSLRRGMTEEQKRLLIKVKKAKEGKIKKAIKTHCRDMIIVPQMIGLTLLVHNGKEWAQVIVTHEMLGNFLGEYAHTRKRVAHSAPGIGATRSSAAMSVK